MGSLKRVDGGWWIRSRGWMVVGGFVEEGGWWLVGSLKRVDGGWWIR